MAVYVDTREPDLLYQILGSILRKSGVAVDNVGMDSADYLIVDSCTPQHQYGMERKTASDLIASLGKARASDGVHRLQSQIHRMEKAYTGHGLIIEGGYMLVDGKISVKGRPSGWSHAAVQMLLFSFQIRHGTIIHWTPDKYATLDLVRVLGERAQKGCVWGAGKPDQGD